MLHQLMIVSSLLVLDGFWIKLFMGPLYKEMLGSWMSVSEGYRLLFGLLGAYGLMVVGLFAFVLKPEVSLLEAWLFGTILYGVFAFTNYAIFSNWSIYLVLADIVWGGVIYSAMWYLARVIGYIQ